MANRRLTLLAALISTIALLTTLPAAAGTSSTFVPAQQFGFANGDDWEPAVAVDGTNVYTFWMHFGAYPVGALPTCSINPTSFMVFQRSTDGGKTWQPPQRISCPINGFGADAQLAVTLIPTSNPNRPIHRLYASWMDSNQANSPIFVAYSDDFGATWSVPVNATKLDHGGSGGDKDILVVRGREVWVTWEHLTTNVVAHTTNIETTDFALSKVPNPNGLVSLASGGGMDRSGNLYFVYDGVGQQGGANGPTTMWFTRSVDRGLTWSNPITIDISQSAPKPAGAGWDYFGASAAFAIIPLATGDRLFFIYQKSDLVGMPAQTYARYTDDHGLTWHQESISKANSDPTIMQGFPAAVADGAGVRVTWMDNRTTPGMCLTDDNSCGVWNVWYRTSPDGASAWSAETRLDGPNFVALTPHSYQSSAGFAHPYGDYQWLALDASGHTYSTFGEGPNYVGPGSVWFTRN